MMYDLEELNRDNNLLIEDPAGIDRDRLRNQINLSIAERFDALMEAVKKAGKPSIVILTKIRISDGAEIDWSVNAEFVNEVFAVSISDTEFRTAVVTKTDRQGEFTYVKGTVAEVTAKLRGEQ